MCFCVYIWIETFNPSTSTITRQSHLKEISNKETGNVKSKQILTSFNKFAIPYFANFSILFEKVLHLTAMVLCAGRG